MDNQVIIIGAGPAGLSAARTLLREGIDFTLVDSREFPRGKGCGGGLTPRALKTLEEVFPEIDAQGFSARTLTLFKNAVEGQREIVTYDSKKPIFRVVDRKSFDHLLLQSILERGGNFLRMSVRELIKTEGGFAVNTDQMSLHSKYVIVASGVFGARLAGLEAPRYNIICHGRAPSTNKASITYIPNGYLWRFPCSDFDSIGGGVYPDAPDSTSYNEILKIATETFGRAVEFSGAPIPLFQTERVLELNKSFEGLFFVGDSAGLVDNWTGEGISFALNSGRQAALSIVEDGLKDKKAMERYLERLFPIVRHLQIADAFRKRFNANFERNLALLKNDKFSRLFVNYISGYVKSPFALAFKSLLTAGIRTRST